MRRRIFNRTTGAGIGSLLLAVLPFTLEDNTMNPTTWALLVIGVGLVLWGVFKKPQRRLGLSELKEIVGKREEYLNPLKDNINKRLSRANDLVKDASEYPLEEYQKKYAPTKHMPAIGVYSWIFLKLRFIIDNLYYESLKENDLKYRQLIQEYRFLYTQIKDNKLKKKLDGLWDLEHQHNSINIFTLLSKNHPAVRNTPHGLRTARFGEKFGVAAFNRQLDGVMKRISLLLDGGEDE
jgi:hypothetical protein